MAVLLGVVVGCRPAVAPGGSQMVVAPPGAGSAALPASSASPIVTNDPSSTVAGRDAPPNALLAAEGGDPVAGQLGTFAWFDTGSDSPWLLGAPLAVGAGEPLTVSLVPDDGTRAWAARYVPAAITGPEGAVTLGGGTGRPRFEAPGPGAWTVELFVEFASGVGDARYFWRLEVE